jgi:hypothetical protein
MANFEALEDPESLNSFAAKFNFLLSKPLKFLASLRSTALVLLQNSSQFIRISGYMRLRDHGNWS